MGFAASVAGRKYYRQFYNANFSSGRKSNFDQQILTSIISGPGRRNTNPTPAASPNRYTLPKRTLK